MNRIVVTAGALLALCVVAVLLATLRATERESAAAVEAQALALSAAERQLLHEVMRERDEDAAHAAHTSTTHMTPRARPRAYFALAAGRDRWFECLRLAYGLQQYGARHAFVCGTLEPGSALSAAEAAAAAALNMTFAHWTPFWSPATRWGGWDGVRGNWRVSWEKLNALRMHEYDALVHLDTDVVLTRAADELFDTVSDDYPFAQTFGHDSCGTPYGLNGGVFVVRPLPSVHERLVGFLDRPCEGRTNPHCDWLFGGSDQTVLALTMGELPHVADALWGRGRRMTVLSHNYNMWARACTCDHAHETARSAVIYHLISPKPWQARADPPCAAPLFDIYKRQADGVRDWLKAHHPAAAATFPLST